MGQWRGIETAAGWFEHGLGNGTDGMHPLAQLPCRIACLKLLILRCQAEPYLAAHKHKISGRVCVRGIAETGTEALKLSSGFFSFNTRP